MSHDDSLEPHGASEELGASDDWAKRRDFRSPMARAKWTAGLLLAFLATEIGSCATYLSASQTVRSIRDGIEVDQAYFEQLARWEGVLGILQFAVWVGTVVAFLMWIYRVRYNLPSLSDAEYQNSQKMAVAGFFIPIANLVIPYRVMQEVFRWSRPFQLDSDGMTASSRPSFLVFAWWMSFLAMNFTNGISANWLNALEEEEAPAIEEIILAFDLAWISSLLGTIASAMAAYLVWRVSRNQVEKNEQIDAALVGATA